MSQDRSPLILGTENVWKLLIRYAIPSVVAMTASSLYNITDSIFIGHGVGPMAISGLAITFPLMNLGAAYGSLIGVGAATLMSLRLGQKDYQSANHILGNVFMLNLILGLAYTIIIFAFLDPILLFFGASDKTLPYAHSYMVVITLGNIISHTYLGLNAMLRSVGKPNKAMISTISTVIINAILTPVFIYVLNMGIKGAALATLISQSILLIWQIRIFSDKESFIHLQKGIYKLKKKIVFDSLSIGMAPFLINTAACLVVIVLNRSLIKYGGDLAVGAYGIINRIIFLFAMIVLGLTQGMQPIAGFNYGAKNYTRVNQVLKYTIFLATIVTTSGFIIGEFFPRAIALLFTKDNTLIELAINGLRIVVLLFPIIGFQIVTGIFFQSIGKPKQSILLSVTRQVVFLLPCLFVFPRFWDLNGVWASLPVSDFMASLLSGYLLFKHFRKSRYLDQQQVKTNCS